MEKDIEVDGELICDTKQKTLTQTFKLVNRNRQIWLKPKKNIAPNHSQFNFQQHTKFNNIPCTPVYSCLRRETSQRQIFIYKQKIGSTNWKLWQRKQKQHKLQTMLRKKRRVTHKCVHLRHEKMPKTNRNLVYRHDSGWSTATNGSSTACKNSIICYQILTNKQKQNGRSDRLLILTKTKQTLILLLLLKVNKTKTENLIVNNRS